MASIPLNSSCFTCGSRDFLEIAIVGETISQNALKERGIFLEEGDEVFICWECLPEVII